MACPYSFRVPFPTGSSEPRPAYYMHMPYSPSKCPYIYVYNLGPVSTNLSLAFNQLGDGLIVCLFPRSETLVTLSACKG